MSQHAATLDREADETLMTYADAVKRGDYDTHIGNLTGKHDNVRSYWEDQLTDLPYVHIFQHWSTANETHTRRCGSSI